MTEQERTQLSNLLNEAETNIQQCEDEAKLAFQLRALVIRNILNEPDDVSSALLEERVHLQGFFVIQWAMDNKVVARVDAEARLRSLDGLPGELAQGMRDYYIALQSRGSRGYLNLGNGTQRPVYMEYPKED